MRQRDLIGTTYIHAAWPAVATADATAFLAEVVAPFRCKVVSIDYTAVSTVTGTDTQSRSINVTLKNGSTAVADVDFTLTPPVVATAHTPLAIPLTGTAAQLKLAAGDALAFQSVKVGTGLALAAGTIRVGVQSA